jgi:hypothetical protein
VRIDWKLPATFGCSIGTLLLFAMLFRPICSDCFRPLGWPFPFYRGGGFASGAHYIWVGMLGDAIFAVTAAVILWALWNAVLPRSLRVTERDARRRTWGWVRLFYGLLVLLDLVATVRQHIAGNIDPRFAAANSSELFGMVVAYIIFLALAAWLIGSGLRKIGTPIAPRALEGEALTGEDR